MLSSMYAVLSIPGIGTIHGFCASSQRYLYGIGVFLCDVAQHIHNGHVGLYGFWGKTWKTGTEVGCAIKCGIGGNVACKETRTQWAPRNEADNKERLKNLLDKHTPQVSSKLFLYDLFIHDYLPSDNNMYSFIDELLLKDIPVLLHLKLGFNYNGDKNEFKQLLKKIIDKPASEIKHFFDVIFTFSSGASYLAKLQLDKDLYPLLERANRSWADDVLSIIKDLNELFDKIFKDTSHSFPIKTFVARVWPINFCR